MNKKTKRVIIFISIFLIVSSAILIWLSNSYKATSEVDEYLISTNNVEVFKDSNNFYTFKPKNPSTAIIFYPGGKVDSNAYSPLLFKLAEEGFLVVLIEFPFNLAVFDINAAKLVRDLYPEISNWYLAGHSLGGSMAASHISKNEEKYNGLILLGSYSTVNISKTDLNVLSIYGEHDLVLNKKKYRKNLSNLPNPKEYIIVGGNHAYFGYYGNQKGDGVASIGRTKQINETILFIKNNV